MPSPSRADLGWGERPGDIDAVAAVAEEAAFGRALSEFLDRFYLSSGAQRQAMLDPVPRLTGDSRRDALLGAVAEHLALRWRLDPPAWTEDPARFLRRPFFLDNGLTGMRATYMVESPTAFRRRFIFTEAEPLRRARFPREPGQGGMK